MPSVGKFSKDMRKEIRSHMLKGKKGQKGKGKYGGCDPNVTLLVHRLPPATTSETVNFIYFIYI